LQASIQQVFKMKRFDIIEHTADVGIIAYGGDLREAFANAAFAMFTLIADLEKVEEVDCCQIEVQAEDRESLVVACLNELLYLVDIEGVIFRRFEAIDLSEVGLKMKCYGERIDPVRHELRGGVKAATYHMLKVESNDVHKIQVIFDV
jgi:SHS2 domain-containing protein